MKEFDCTGFRHKLLCYLEDAPGAAAAVVTTTTNNLFLKIIKNLNSVDLDSIRIAGKKMDKVEYKFDTVDSSAPKAKRNRCLIFNLID